MNDFGEFLYALRKEKGMTQAELAEALGVSNKAVSKWETGESMPETSLLVPISQIFGVTVDELLNGKRADSNANDRNRQTVFANDDDIDRFFSQNFKSHVFSRGKEDEENNSLSDKIGAAVCALIFFAGLTAYLIIGGLYNLWHPYWVLLPVCALSCGIVGVIFDLFNPKKREEKVARGENPVVATVCGTVMLSCIIAYLLLGALLGLWHPYWLIVVCGMAFCAIFGSLGKVFGNKKNRQD